MEGLMEGLKAGWELRKNDDVDIGGGGCGYDSESDVRDGGEWRGVAGVKTKTGPNGERVEAREEDDDGDDDMLRPAGARTFMMGY
jgi:hypothetical protein